jgi:hypothetical protein
VPVVVCHGGELRGRDVARVCPMARTIVFSRESDVARDILRFLFSPRSYGDSHERDVADHDAFSTLSTRLSSSRGSSRDIFIFPSVLVLTFAFRTNPIHPFQHPPSSHRGPSAPTTPAPAPPLCGTAGAAPACPPNPRVAFIAPSARGGRARAGKGICMGRRGERGFLRGGGGDAEAGVFDRRRAGGKGRVKRSGGGKGTPVSAPVLSSRSCAGGARVWIFCQTTFCNIICWLLAG